MLRLLTFIILAWIINKSFRIIFSIFRKPHDSPRENKPQQSRQDMDIQDAEFEDVE
ncbi:MAG: hypothetical protein HN820_08335 [Candidatus Marinimicrobia bacterium]|jgi:hypothetical protein|nr:hypothetical protein [Candidatus Neomarinimicrobiota bacterium]MBT6871274.1 hypothetical protein [Candidatus Neomarinimicrobiota bacterium]MBT7378146.1 hypothetical protein [Candidatus Neomarinimicrobiota bacterium]|tara:strand:- start:208 stop:375 length:168 start_codon:yes stop_codon:yes gene_type:complete